MVEAEDTVNKFPIPPVVIEHFKKLSPPGTIEDILRVRLDSSEDENITSAWLHPGSAMTQKMNCLDSYFKIKSPSQKPKKHKTEQGSNPPTSGCESLQTPTILHSISDEADTSDSTSESKIKVTSHNVAESTTAHSQSHTKESERGTVVEDCNKSPTHDGSDNDNNKTALSKIDSPPHSNSLRVNDSTSEKSQLIESLLFTAANKLTPKSLTSNFQKNQIVSSTPKLHSTPGGVQDGTLGSTFQSTGLETDLNSTLLGTSALDKINFDDPTTCKGIVFSEDLKEDDEIFIVQCPKELDVRLLKGKRISLKGESSLQLQSGDSMQKYEALASEETLRRNVNLILPSQTTRSFKLVTLPLAGSILMTVDAEIPTIEEEEESHFYEKSKIALPKGLKERHPLLGRDYQAVTNATPSLNFMLSEVKTEKVSKSESEFNTESGDNVKKKKKKKKKNKTDSNSMELTELQSPKKEVSEAPVHQITIPEPTPTMKKKKSKHSFYDPLAVQHLTASLNLELSQIKVDESEQLNTEKSKDKKKKKKKKKAEHQEIYPESPPKKKKKKSKHSFDPHTVTNLTNSLSVELSQMKSENVEKNESEVLNTESRDKEKKKKKKKKKEKDDADPGLAPTKKKKKSKPSFGQQSIEDLTKRIMLEVSKVKSENYANENEFVNTEPRKKKKKRKADVDELQTSSFHDGNQPDFTPKKKKRKQMSEEI